MPASRYPGSPALISLVALVPPRRKKRERGETTGGPAQNLLDMPTLQST